MFSQGRTIAFRDEVPGVYLRWGKWPTETALPDDFSYDILGNYDTFVVLAVNLSTPSGGTPLKFQPSSKHIYHVKRSVLQHHVKHLWEYHPDVGMALVRR